MFLFNTQQVRNQYGISWSEEFLMGAIDSLGASWTNDVIDVVRETMSPNTAHKYIMQLIDKGYAEQRRGSKDKRYAHVSLSAKGRAYLSAVEKCV